MDHHSIKVGNFNNTSMDSFNRLVKLTARAFYDDITTSGDNQPPKPGRRTDNRGIGVVVLDALTRRQWAREEDLAKDLKLHAKQLRRVLRFFEEEKLVTRVHRKETGAKLYGADGGREGEGKIKLHTHSYCRLDYVQIYDVVRFRMHRVKKKIKDQLEDHNRNTIQKYLCPDCKRRYTAFDALHLVSSVDDECFHCEHCNGELVVESDELAAEEMGDGGDNARRRRREKFKDVLPRFEEKLKPLTDLLNRVKDLPAPEFKTLQDWEVEAYAAARSNGDANDNDPSKSSQSYNGTPMPSLGETEVEVAFDVQEKGANAKSDNTSTPTKVLPPWMIKRGMVLTDEQRGEVKQESNMEGASPTAGLSDDKNKSIDQKDEKNLQVAYLEAYYAALFQRQQQEQEESNKRKQEPFNNTTDDTTWRQVGMKSKRGYNDQDENVEWEEAPTAGNTGGTNVEADALGDEEDDIDWEEG